MATMVSYDTMRGRLALFDDYKHGSSHAYRHTYLDDSGKVYRTVYQVYSYNTCVLRAKLVGYDWEIVYYNDRKYSRTTSRLQSILRQVYDIPLTVFDSVISETDPQTARRFRHY